jgi:hypothetical protein
MQDLYVAIVAVGAGYVTIVPAVWMLIVGGSRLVRDTDIQG